MLYLLSESPEINQCCGIHSIWGLFTDQTSLFGYAYANGSIPLIVYVCPESCCVLRGIPVRSIAQWVCYCPAILLWFFPIFTVFLTMPRFRIWRELHGGIVHLLWLYVSTFFRPQPVLASLSASNDKQRMIYCSGGSATPTAFCLQLPQISGQYAERSPERNPMVLNCESFL